MHKPIYIISLDSKQIPFEEDILAQVAHIADYIQEDPSLWSNDDFHDELTKMFHGADRNIGQVYTVTIGSVQEYLNAIVRKIENYAHKLSEESFSAWKHELQWEIIEDHKIFILDGEYMGGAEFANALYRRMRKNNAKSITFKLEKIYDCHI